VDADGRRWFNSGDLARIDEDGTCGGRASEGPDHPGRHNIDPQMIEERLCEHPDVVLAPQSGSRTPTQARCRWRTWCCGTAALSPPRAARVRRERVPKERRCRCESRSSADADDRVGRSSSRGCVTLRSSGCAASTSGCRHRGGDHGMRRQAPRHRRDDSSGRCGAPRSGD